MFDCKSSELIDRLPPPEDSSISLTALWEIIVRTKRLPANINLPHLFAILRARLHNPECEVRQNALRVLADLIPLLGPRLHPHLPPLLPHLVANLSHLSPSVRKGARDVLRTYLRSAPHRHQVLADLLNSTPKDELEGLHSSLPHLYSRIWGDETLRLMIDSLFDGLSVEFLRESCFSALLEVRRRVGGERFEWVVGKKWGRKWEEVCKERNVGVGESEVILETEIRFDEGGRAIMMKIHEEDDKSFDIEHESPTRSPRKVHFGGEIIKMRTPESDSQHSSDDLQSSHTVERPTSIKITVHNTTTSIKTYKSQIPVRIASSSAASTPTTPSKRLKAKSFHKSAPELSSSRIPLRKEASKPAKRLKVTNLLSPSPIHHEIEVFHNLTRSPIRTPTTVESLKKNEEVGEAVEKIVDKVELKGEEDKAKEFYNSFRVCEEKLEEKVGRNDLGANHLANVVRDLITMDDTWTKTRALDDLIVIINKTNPELESVSSKALFHALFACEKEKRCKIKAQEVLTIFLTKLNLQNVDQDVAEAILSGLLQTQPLNTRLALSIMKKNGVRSFFELLKAVERSESIEEVLQLLIVASRTFPSSELNLIQSVRFAFGAMKNEKRSVKQAALETLASLAQVAGNGAVLEILNKIVDEEHENKAFLRIVRTRLSRRQLPMVDESGNVRYSSPREQEELDWVCGSSLKEKPVVLNPIQTFSSNYWKKNSRHDGTIIKCESKKSINGDSWSFDQAFEDDSSIPKIEIGQLEKATLYPVYILHRETPQVNGKSYRNFDRGRSQSPPPKQTDSHINQQPKRFINQQQFRKSFSSEHISSTNPSTSSGNFRHLSQPNSLSSRSSTTDSSSSRTSNLWFKDFRSNIPLPIESNKFKVRHRQREHNFGPLVASQKNFTVCSTKLESASCTPTQPRKNATPVYLQPPSSGSSESSGYFTPPADQLIKNSSAVERNNDYEENNNNSSIDEPNLHVNETERDIQDEKLLLDLINQSSSEEQHLESFDEPDNYQKCDDSPFENVNFDEINRNFDQPRSKSRIELYNFKSSLPDINIKDRKSVNSAPPLNEMVALVPVTNDEVVAVPIPSVLPGSIIPSSSDCSLNKLATNPKRLLRRTSSVRPPFPRPPTGPPSPLPQILAQISHAEWESNIAGLTGLVHLCQPAHAAALAAHAHPVALALARAVRNLRSQVARAACLAAARLFAALRRQLDAEAEALAVPLLARAADTNRFLRGDANRALDAMAAHLTAARVVAVVGARGAAHPNSVVRACAVRLLSELAARLGAARVFGMGREVRERLLVVGANGLMEGSLESRKYAKCLMGVLAEHEMFQKALFDAVPQHTLRHISKILSTIVK